MSIVYDLVDCSIAAAGQSPGENLFIWDFITLGFGDFSLFLNFPSQSPWIDGTGDVEGRFGFPGSKSQLTLLGHTRGAALTL